MGSFVNYPSMGVYTASKAAIDSFSEALSHEVASFGIRVHVIVPGFFPTAILGPVPDNSENKAAVPVADDLSKVYTKEGQGYNIVNTTPYIRAATGHVGD
jgi:short-subunit dehydrogenase